jgi:CRP-like cAMP-binding protein
METLKRKVETLQAIPAFAKLPPARLKLVAQAAEGVRFGAGDVIVQQGDAADAVYVLTEGTAEVWLMDAPTRPALLRTMGPGHLFGETAVLYNGARSATIKAKTEALTLRIPGECFLDLLRSTPELAMQVAVILAERLASDRRRLTVEPMQS